MLRCVFLGNGCYLQNKFKLNEFIRVPFVGFVCMLDMSFVSLLAKKQILHHWAHLMSTHCCSPYLIDVKKFIAGHKSDSYRVTTCISDTKNKQYKLFL